MAPSFQVGEIQRASTRPEAAPFLPRFQSCSGESTDNNVSRRKIRTDAILPVRRARLRAISG
ncbi:hypothetical protein CTI14_16815, partial [Methylobacterium radiotolerans]